MELRPRRASRRTSLGEKERKEGIQTERQRRMYFQGRREAGGPLLPAYLQLSIMWGLLCWGSRVSSSVSH